MRLSVATFAYPVSTRKARASRDRCSRERRGLPTLFATGTPPVLFNDADGTSQRERFRRYLTTVVQPLSRLLEAELRQKFDAPELGLSFDGLYAHDLQGRATAFSKLIAGGLPVQDALVTSGLIGATGE